MADFVNTIDLLGDEALTKAIVERTITEFNDNILKTVGSYAFCSCHALASVNLPLAEALSERAFSSCTALGWVDFGKKISFSSYAFQSCTALKTVILRNSEVCTLKNSNVFLSTPFESGGTGGKAIIPRSLIESYQTGTNWSTLYAAGTCEFLALEDYTVDGTITGAIDWDKLGGTT